MPLVDKYAPNTLDSLIGREVIVENIKHQLQKPDGIPHMMFYGPQGTGKTSMAHIIGNEIFGNRKAQNFFEFNASNDRGIDAMRSEVIPICSNRPMSGEYKVILMDEADQLTTDAQGLLRRVFEQYSKYTRFIFTANLPYKIIPPILSRLVRIEFPRIDNREVAKYLQKIVSSEGLKHSNDEIISITKTFNGDLRACLNALENIFNTSDVIKIFENMTLVKLSAMSRDDRINLAFQMDPDATFGKIWEFVQREKMWDKLPLLADCQSKMNYSAIKTVFLANLLDKLV